MSWSLPQGTSSLLLDTCRHETWYTDCQTTVNTLHTLGGNRDRNDSVNTLRAFYVKIHIPLLRKIRTADPVKCSAVMNSHMIRSKTKRHSAPPLRSEAQECSPWLSQKSWRCHSNLIPGIAYVSGNTNSLFAVKLLGNLILVTLPWHLSCAI